MKTVVSTPSCFVTRINKICLYKGINELSVNMTTFKYPLLLLLLLLLLLVVLVVVVVLIVVVVVVVVGIVVGIVVVVNTHHKP